MDPVIGQFGVVIAASLTADHLRELFDGTVGIVRIPHFTDRVTRERALSGLTEDHFRPYDPRLELGGVDQGRGSWRRADSPDLTDDLSGLYDMEAITPRVRRLGMTLFEYTCRNEVDEYFLHSEAAHGARREAFSMSGDLLELALASLQTAWPRPGAVAMEPGGRRYFAGIVRDVYGASRIHTDDAREEEPDRLVGMVQGQLAMYLYLTMPRPGGAVVVYDRPWRHQDEVHRDGYGFSPEAVSGDSFVGVTPAAGDLILFPSTHLHRIETCAGIGPRIILSAFVGRLPDGTLACWS